MTLDRAAPNTSVIDLLDRILDKGIVIDAWVRVSLAGIDLITVEARVVVASFHTYLTYADAMSRREPLSTAVHAAPAHRLTLEDQLRRFQKQMERQLFEPHAHRRRWDDRVRDEHYDSLATTVVTTPAGLRRSRRPLPQA
jgi:gas vesicle structural protein